MYLIHMRALEGCGPIRTTAKRNLRVFCSREYSPSEYFEFTVNSECGSDAQQLAHSEIRKISVRSHEFRVQRGTHLARGRG